MEKEQLREALQEIFGESAKVRDSLGSYGIDVASDSGMYKLETIVQTVLKEAHLDHVLSVEAFPLRQEHRDPDSANMDFGGVATVGGKQVSIRVKEGSTDEDIQKALDVLAGVKDQIQAAAQDEGPSIPDGWGNRVRASHQGWVR